jgi:hypothetical protein
MTARQGWSRVVVAALGGAIAVLAVWRCAHGTKLPSAGSGEPPALQPAPAQPSAAEQAHAKAPALAAPAAAPTAPSAQPSAAESTNTVARVMRATDPADRDFLAEVERQTHAAPPPSVQRLIELRGSGATRTELSQFIQQQLDHNMIVQTAARRWLHSFAPPPVAPDSPQAPPAAPGSGGGVRTIKPIGRTPVAPAPH